MIYKVNIRYTGDWECKVEAESKHDAREKANAAFANLTPDELAHFITTSFVDDCYQVDDVPLAADEFNGS